jgi:uncharacterized protein (UPF0335 family)
MEGDGMSNGQLKALAERIERLMDERDGIQSDIRDIYSEAKGVGYVPKVLRKAITRKRMDAGKRDEEDAILELYEGALSPTMRKVVAMAKAGASSHQIEAETGMDHATVARSVALNKKSAPKTETAARSENATPSEGSERADNEAASGVSLATHSEAAPSAQATACLGQPQTDGVPSASVTPVPDEGVGAGTHSDADRLRAQKASSTDPERLEREAERAEAASDPWEAALASKARLDALKAARSRA